MAKRKTKKVAPISTPELDKMRAVQEQSQAIGSFIEWLSTKDYVIGRHLTMEEVDQLGLDPDETNIIPVYSSIEKILAEYFEIDLNKVEQERTKLLEQIQDANVKSKANGN